MGGWEPQWVVGKPNRWLGTKKFPTFIGYAVTRLRICYCMFNYTQLLLRYIDFFGSFCKWLVVKVFEKAEIQCTFAEITNWLYNRLFLDTFSALLFEL